MNHPHYRQRIIDHPAVFSLHTNEVGWVVTLVSGWVWPDGRSSRTFNGYGFREILSKLHKEIREI